MKTSISLLATLLVVVGAGITQDVEELPNLEIVSSYFDAGFIEEPTSPQHDINTFAEHETSSNLRGNQHTERSLRTSKPVWQPVPTPSNYAHQNSKPSANKPSLNQPTFKATGAGLEPFPAATKVAFQSRMGCGSNERKAKFDIQLDRFGPETTWSLQNSNGKVIMKNSRTYAKKDKEVMSMCLPNDDYKLIIYDEGGK